MCSSPHTLAVVQIETRVVKGENKNEFRIVIIRGFWPAIGDSNYPQENEAWVAVSNAYGKAVCSLVHLYCRRHNFYCVRFLRRNYQGAVTDERGIGAEGDILEAMVLNSDSMVGYFKCRQDLDQDCLLP